MELFAKIRRDARVEGLSIRGLAKRHQIGRDTVRQGFVLGGADDFLIHINARDTEHIRQFVLEHLSSNPAVAGTQASLVFEHGPACEGQPAFNCSRGFGISLGARRTATVNT
jgi:DNA-binding Lrp family transcriptional regulator